MQHKSFGNMQCPIARSLERVGEWWSILILRDAFLGLTRFDQFQKSLDIAPNILARRLSALVEAGLLEHGGMTPAEVQQYYAEVHGFYEALPADPSADGAYQTWRQQIRQCFTSTGLHEHREVT